MKGEDHRKVDAQNREVITDFLNQSAQWGDDVSGSAIATITQFLMQLRSLIGKRYGHRGWLYSDEIINAQIEVLRQCIIDLEAYKQRLIKGETKQ